ncbi:MAG: hypothetical protein A3E01_19345 [Gammaproteobacteria bacterium RIFCSPHIGHO2_12_FULL_63_22]|nr:MAG: hypothetical protein A3E01_19345 [Gammaproteobacteria bacterium RIFCSPHIGHO2_12_FULL_63_22]
MVFCLREATEAHQGRGLLPDLDAIVEAALTGVAKVVDIEPGASTSQPFIPMSTDDGDAWMLDPEGGRVLCLAWHGDRQSISVRDLSARIKIEWDGRFELSGPFFILSTEHPLVGSRHIRGYPVEELHQVLEDVRSADKRIEGIFAPHDDVELTADFIENIPL